MTENISVDKRLALIADHVAGDIDVVFLWLNDDCDEFGDFKAHRVIEGEHLLLLGGPLQFFRGQDSVLIDLCEDLSNSF